MTTQAVSRKLTLQMSPTIPTAGLNAIEALLNGQEAEALAFLAKRPTHTVMLGGLIHDNGLVSPLNRGTFYGYRNANSELEGIVIVGEVVIFEARSERSLEAFARLAQTYPSAYVIVGEHDKVTRFWNYYEQTGQEPRMFSRELLFELQPPVTVADPVPELRQADPRDLNHIVRVHARMAFEESGIDPLKVDPEGFRLRCLRRIEQGRIWVWIDDERLIFKADVISETPDVFYLEGIFTDPQERGKNIASRCLAQLGHDLLSRTKSICLLSNEQNLAANELYRKCNYKLRSLYDTIFLQKENVT